MSLHVLQALHQLLGAAHQAHNTPQYEDGSGPGVPMALPNQNPHLQMQQAYRGSLGTDDPGGRPLQAPYDQADLAQPVLPNWQQHPTQGGQYNPGRIPLQQSNIRYRQGPQPAQPWFDF